MSARVDFEQRFERALRRILAYMTPAQLRRRCEKEYGLSYEEALEMTYKNIQGEARAGLSGVRRKNRRKEPTEP